MTEEGEDMIKLFKKRFKLEVTEICFSKIFKIHCHHIVIAPWICD